MKQTIPEDGFSRDKSEAQGDHSSNQQAELRFVTVLLASVVNEIFTYKHKMYTKSMLYNSKILSGLIAPILQKSGTVPGI